MAKANERFAWDDCMASRWFVFGGFPKIHRYIFNRFGTVDDALKDTMYNIPRVFLCIRDYEHDES